MTKNWGQCLTAHELSTHWGTGMLQWSTRDSKRPEPIRTQSAMEWPTVLDSDAARARAAELLKRADEIDRIQ